MSSSIDTNVYHNQIPIYGYPPNQDSPLTNFFVNQIELKDRELSIKDENIKMLKESIENLKQDNFYLRKDISFLERKIAEIERYNKELYDDRESHQNRKRQRIESPLPSPSFQSENTPVRVYKHKLCRYFHGLDKNC